MSLLLRCREQKASHRKGLRRRGAICGVAAPLRCAEASPSSRLLASDPAALATPPHTLFQQPASEPSGTIFRNPFGILPDFFVGSGSALSHGEAGGERASGRLSS